MRRRSATRRPTRRRRRRPKASRRHRQRHRRLARREAQRRAQRASAAARREVAEAFGAAPIKCRPDAPARSGDATMTKPIERLATALPMPFSQAVRANGFLFLSGVLPMNEDGQLVAGDITVQTRTVVERIAATLAECGASLADVVRVTVWLADLEDFPPSTSNTSAISEARCQRARPFRPSSTVARASRSKCRRARPRDRAASACAIDATLQVPCCRRLLERSRQSCGHVPTIGREPWRGAAMRALAKALPCA